MKDNVHPSSLSPGHRVRLTANNSSEAASNETLVFVEPEKPKPIKITLRPVPRTPPPKPPSAPKRVEPKYIDVDPDDDEAMQEMTDHICGRPLGWFEGVVKR